MKVTFLLGTILLSALSLPAFAGKEIIRHLYLHQSWYIFYTVITFEFIEQKSHANLLKHGIYFIDAQALWDAPRLLETPASTEGELRYLLIRLIGGMYWSAVITHRNARIRLLFVRRSRPERLPYMKAKIFGQKFNKCVDITESLDLSRSKRVLQEQRRGAP